MRGRGMETNFCKILKKTSTTWVLLESAQNIIALGFIVSESENRNETDGNLITS